MKLTTIQPQHVVVIPKALEQGVLYISDEYKTAIHLCGCGCGNKVVTPLHVAGWTLAEDDQGVSLSPSIGNGAFPCNSHYWIRSNRLDWTLAMTPEATDKAMERDRARARAAQPRHANWRRIWNFLFNRRR